VTALPATELRAEHDEVLARLSSRRSMVHVAHAAVAGFVAAIFLSAAAKLWWDFSEYHPELYQASLVVSGLGALYAGVRATLGFIDFRRERGELVRLRHLRATLRIDDPATSLP
jgi:hypothetical protein